MLGIVRPHHSGFYVRNFKNLQGKPAEFSQQIVVSDVAHLKIALYINKRKGFHYSQIFLALIE